MEQQKVSCGVGPSALWGTLQILIASLCVFVIWPATGVRSQPTTGEDLALALRDHVVGIRAEWPNGSAQEGFGFVVGQGPSGIYVVTADHVVRGDMPEQGAPAVTVTWFRRRGESFPAALLGTHDKSRDLAVLRTALPEGLELDEDLMVAPRGDVKRSAPVWYVGRTRDWYVPSQAGTVNSISLEERIAVDGLSVQVGTSGAPLVTNEGIVGMIVRDSIDGVAEAVSIGFIERAFNNWAHPWGINEVPGRGDSPSGLQEMDRLKTDLAKRQAEIERIQSRLDSTTGALMEASAKVKATAAEKDLLIAELDTSANELEQSRALLAQQRKTSDEGKQQVEQLTGQIDELQRKLSSLQESLDDAGATASPTPEQPEDYKAWGKVANSRNVEDLERFVEQFPHSFLVGAANDRMTILRDVPQTTSAEEDELAAWDALRDETDPVAWEQFLEKFPASSHAASASVALQRLSWKTLEQTENAAALEEFLDRFPSGPYATLARARLDEMRALARINELPGNLVQIALKALGHDPGTVDGVFGPKSSNAVRGFQISLGVQPTGMLTPTQTVALIARAANEGDAESQNTYGIMYGQGIGITQDYGEAANWFGKSAGQNNDYAKVNLALLYKDGHGVPPDLPRAKSLLTEAAENGQAQARQFLEELD